MTQPHSLSTFASALLAAFAMTVSYGQNAQPAPKAQAAVPVTMTECEGTNNCATWTFLGGTGNGRWPSGEIANLTVERSDASTVVIRRADSTGASAGLTAVYTGTRHDDRVGGEFTSSWPGHWAGRSGNWYATVEKGPVSPPSVMHFCAAHCLTFTWENGVYTNYTNLPGQSAERRVLTIESFTRSSVVLRRADTGSNPMTATMRGQMAADGNSVVNGMSDGTSPFKLAWGAALHTLPGSDEERDYGKPQPQVIVMPAVVCIPWFFTVVCGP
jgi:hypothetical protein